MLNKPARVFIIAPLVQYCKNFCKISQSSLIKNLFLFFEIFCRLNNNIEQSSAFKTLRFCNIVLNNCGAIYEKLREEILMSITTQALKPSALKPWLKYYSEEAIQEKLPECTMYDLIYQKNQSNLSHTALNYFGKKISYKLFLKK